MSVWSCSVTSRLGLVWSSTYLLEASGTSALGVGKGLSHVWPSVSTQWWASIAVPPVMMRTLFLPGPCVTWSERFWSWLGSVSGASGTWTLAFVWPLIVSISSWLMSAGSMTMVAGWFPDASCGVAMPSATTLPIGG